MQPTESSAPTRSFLFATALAVVPVAATAQCTNPWRSMQSLAGTDGSVRAITTWDPDGPGPATPVWVAGGDFTRAGAGSARHLVAIDPAANTWSELGGGTDGPVHALAVTPNGDLVVGGDFSTAGGVPTANVARFDGSTWTPLGTGCNDLVAAVAAMPNGDVVAGGQFTAAGGTTVAHLARWDGAAWSGLGTGVDGSVQALVVDRNGGLVAGGSFHDAGGSPAGNIARWDGTAWTALNSNPAAFFSIVNAIFELPNGDLVVGGAGLTMLGNSRIARLAGGVWQAMGSWPGAAVQSLAALANGDVVAGGFLSANSTATHVSRWNGSSWSSLGSGLNLDVRALLALPGGDLLAGGDFLSPGPAGFSRFARWNGTAWVAVSSSGAGPIDDVIDVATMADGSLVVSHRMHLGHTRYLVSRWDGATWAALGSDPDHEVQALLPLPNGDLIAGGRFTSIGGVAANRVARWSGTSWSPLGGGVGAVGSTFGEVVAALARLPDGDLVAAGSFLTAGGAPAPNIARWNGASWSPVGPGLQGSVTALLVLSGGDLVAGGTFFTDGNGAFLGRIGRWDGSAWRNFGAGLGGTVTALAPLPGGDLVAAVSTPAGGALVAELMRWSGAWTVFSHVAGSSVDALLALPGGDLVAGGRFTSVGNVPAANLARWDRTAWQGFGSGLDDGARALAWRDTGDVFVGGGFATAGGVSSPFLARLSTTCPATTTVTAAGCSGAGGPNVLTATSQPWLGAVFRSRATGLAPNALAASVLGFGQLAQPLSSLLPQGGPGCVLGVTPDVVELRLPVAGTVDLALQLGRSIVFLGLPLHQQVLALELSPSGNAAGFTSTNGLRFVHGSF